MAYLRCTGTPGGSLKLRNAQGEIASFETNIVDLLQEVKCEINATGGNGTPDNPNPINGYTKASITRCGVNLWDEEWFVSSSRVQSKNFIPVTPETTYCRVSPNNIIPFYYDRNKEQIGMGIWGTGTFTTPANCYYIKFQVDPVYGETYNNDISINYPATDTQYHAYTGNTYTIAFGQTVYGGVLDVTRGKLYVTHGYFMFNGSSMGGWSLGGDYGSSTRFDYSNSLIKPNTVVKSNLLPSGSVGNDREIITTHGSANRIILEIATSRLETANVSGFGAYLENNNLQVVYELATPFDIDLTPEQIEALLGVNNVWHDGNGNTEVKYLYNA